MTFIYARSGIVYLCHRRDHNDLFAELPRKVNGVLCAAGSPVVNRNHQVAAINEGAVSDEHAVAGVDRRQALYTVAPAEYLVVAALVRIVPPALLTPAGQQRNDEHPEGQGGNFHRC